MPWPGTNFNTNYVAKQQCLQDFIHTSPINIFQSEIVWCSYTTSYVLTRIYLLMKLDKPSWFIIPQNIWSSMWMMYDNGMSEVIKWQKFRFSHRGRYKSAWICNNTTYHSTFSWILPLNSVCQILNQLMNAATLNQNLSTRYTYGAQRWWLKISTTP